MYKPEDIQQQFDAAISTHLQRKNRGGDSGQKGTRYEDYFAVYKLAQLAPVIMESEFTIDFLSQILAFVDDLIIDIEAEPIQHYQLKNSSTVSWAGHHLSVAMMNAMEIQATPQKTFKEQSVYLVATAEDADFLALGVLDEV